VASSSGRSIPSNAISVPRRGRQNARLSTIFLFTPAPKRKGAITRSAAGDRILFGKYAGTEIKIDGIDHIILREDEVLGVLE
jgi:co-chaperonin GroES (HSP10)